MDSGEYYWNGGIFIWQVATILSEMARLLPELHAELLPVAEAWDSPQRGEVLTAAWERVPRTTIDYGIMEGAERVAVVPVDIGWDDVGNWATLSDLVESDDAGNVVHGDGQPLLLDTTDTYVYSSAGRLVATLGLEGFVVVDTADALLICPKDQAQAVRDVVAEAKGGGKAGVPLATSSPSQVGWEDRPPLLGDRVRGNSVIEVHMSDEPILGYCVKCKEKREMASAEAIFLGEQAARRRAASAPSAAPR